MKPGVVVIAGLALLSLLSGCGKDMKVSLKPSEGERNGTASLVRNVEVSYRDPKGQEQVRESVPVLSLSQPMSMRADLLKDVKVEKEGVFEARAYSGDGVLLLNGRASADPGESDGVEIELGRNAGKPSELGSPLLRRVRLVDAQLGRDFTQESRELRKGMDEQRCVTLPPLTLDWSSGTHPKIVLEGAVKAPKFSIEVGLGLGREALKFLSSRIEAAVNPAGDAEFELGRELLKGVLFSSPAHLILKIHSDRYEGCLDIQTHPKIQPVTASFALGKGAGFEWSPGQTNHAVGGLIVSNPNLAPVFVRVEGIATSIETGQRLGPLFDTSLGPLERSQLTSDNSVRMAREVPPGGALTIGIFGGMALDGTSHRHRIRVAWSVQTAMSPNDGQVLMTPVTDGVIP